VWMPAPRNVALGLDPLDHELHRQMLVAGVRDLPAHGRALRQRTAEPDPEPRPELVSIGDGPPDPRARRPQHDSLLDLIRNHRGHAQPPGCITYRTRGTICNLTVACRGSVAQHGEGRTR